MVWLCCGWVQGGTPLPRNTGRYDFAALSAKLQSYITDGSETGFVVTVVKDGEIVFEQGFGNYGLSRVTSIASASKMPSSLAVMKLVDGGLVKLDDPVSKYIPNWPADKAAMTVAHLLSCTSGFPFDQSAVNDKTITLEQAVAQIAQMPLEFPPGTQFCYNPNGFHVAARIVEVVTGTSWNAHFKSTLYDPLGMSTFVYSGQANPWVAGGVSTHSEDYVKILAVHLNQGWWPGGRIYEPETIAVMREDFIGSKPIFASPAPTDDWHYGLSWWLSPPVSGNTVTEVSDQGAFGTTPWLDIERNYGALILINKTTVNGNKIWNAIRPIINGTLDAANEPATLRLQPVGVTVNAGEAANFYALGAGHAPLTYQWRKDGKDIPGATNSVLRLPVATGIDAGLYSVAVGNSVNTVESNAVPLTVNLTAQTIAFAALGNKTVDDAPFQLSAVASSGLAVSFSVVSGPATVAGETVTLTGVGVVVVRASQAGDGYYAAASDVDQAFEVVAIPGGGGDGTGGSGRAPVDSDGDGVSDSEEIAAGTDPNDANSVPRKTLVVTKLQGAVKFGVEGKDSLRVYGAVTNVPAQFSAAGVNVLVDAGGATAAFTLDKKGVGRAESGTFAIKLKQTRDKVSKTKSFLGGDAPFKVKLAKGTWSDEWADEGLSGAADVKEAPMQMMVVLTLDGVGYGVRVEAVYRARSGVSAGFRN